MVVAHAPVAKRPRPSPAKPRAGARAGSGGDESGEDEWLQCDACDAWRMVPSGYALPKGEWTCSMHPDSTTTCSTEEERYKGSWTFSEDVVQEHAQAAHALALEEGLELEPHVAHVESRRSSEGKPHCARVALGGGLAPTRLGAFVAVEEAALVLARFKTLLAPPSSALGLRHPLVGKRLEVYWPVDASWYTAEVTALAPEPGCFKLRYTDGHVDPSANLTGGGEVFCEVGSGWADDSELAILKRRPPVGRAGGVERLLFELLFEAQRREEGEASGGGEDDVEAVAAAFEAVRTEGGDAWEALKAEVERRRAKARVHKVIVAELSAEQVHAQAAIERLELRRSGGSSGFYNVMPVAAGLKSVKGVAPNGRGVTRIAYRALAPRVHMHALGAAPAAEPSGVDGGGAGGGGAGKGTGGSTELGLYWEPEQAALIVARWVGALQRVVDGAAAAAKLRSSEWQEQVVERAAERAAAERAAAERAAAKGAGAAERDAAAKEKAAAKAKAQAEAKAAAAAKAKARAEAKAAAAAAKAAKDKERSAAQAAKKATHEAERRQKHEAHLAAAAERRKAREAEDPASAAARAAARKNLHKGPQGATVHPENSWLWVAAAYVEAWGGQASQLDEWAVEEKHFASLSKPAIYYVPPRGAKGVVLPKHANGSIRSFDDIVRFLGLMGAGAAGGSAAAALTGSEAEAASTGREEEEELTIHMSA